MKLLYYLVLKPLSYLPDFLLHGISTALYFLVYHVFTYRKKLVLSNLRRAFPDKSEEKIKTLSKLFFRQFCDTMLEILKGFSLTQKEAERRMRVVNPEVLDALFDSGKSVIITGGHYANWEATTLIAPHVKHDLYGLYSPIKNKFIERKVTESRSKFGFQMISTKVYKDALTEMYTKPRAFVFAVDQSPRKGSGHWMSFLGQQTAVLYGAEKTAREFNLAVVAGRISRVARGRYEIAFRLISEDTSSLSEGQLTELCMRDVEEQIKEAPQYWLWSHRRWKHQPEPTA